MTMQTSSPHPQNDRGAVLILFTMMLAIIVVLVGLVIDTTRMTTASQEEAHTADLAAVSFLSAYLESIFQASVFTPQAQMAAFREGLTSAVRIGGLNTVSANRATSPDENTAKIVTADNQLTGQTINDPGPRGHVEIGRWFTAPPDDLDCNNFESIDDKNRSNMCPCARDPATIRPILGCFVSCDNTKGCINPYERSQRQPANAAKVTLKTDKEVGGNSIQNIFSGLTGVDKTDLSEEAIIYVIPRHGVLLFDLSRSTVAETHYQWQKPLLPGTPPPNPPAAPTPRGDYAYKCVDPCTTNPNPQGAYGTCTVLNNPLEPINYTLDSADRASYPPAGFPSGYQNAFSSLQPLSAFCPESDKQCKRQYQCVSVDRDGDGPSPPEDFLVDIGKVSGGGPDKYAQPHSNMLFAARGFLDSLVQNGRYGDTLGFIGFDSTVDVGENFTQTNRYIPSTPVNLGTKSAVTNWAEATNFRKIYDLLNPDAGQRRFRAARNILPRQTSFTNLPLALWHGHNMLRRTRGAESGERYITLISPALTNCYHNSEASKVTPYPSTNVVCGYGYEAHQKSLAEAFNYRIKGSALTTLQGDNIRLHVVPVGTFLQPHSIAVRRYNTDTSSFDSRCYTIPELRRANLLTFIPDYLPGAGIPELGAYDAAAKAYASIGSGPSTKRYNGSTYWLNAAALQLGGIITPIRTAPGCTGISGACDTDFDMTPEIDAACSASNPPHSEALAPPYTVAKGFPGKTIQINVDGTNGILNNTTNVPADNQGRIFCDPKCRERLESNKKGDSVVAQVRGADFIPGETDRNDHAFNVLFGARPPSMALVGQSGN